MRLVDVSLFPHYENKREALVQQRRPALEHRLVTLREEGGAYVVGGRTDPKEHVIGASAERLTSGSAAPLWDAPRGGDAADDDDAPRQALDARAEAAGTAHEPDATEGVAGGEEGCAGMSGSRCHVGEGESGSTSRTNPEGESGGIQGDGSSADRFDPERAQ